VEQQLIELYLRVCTFYDNQPGLKYQRLSNFKPRCTDQEFLTMYLFGHLQGFSQQRRIYQYVRQHWPEWFPTLPSYQAFNRRLNELVGSFEQLIGNTLSAGVEQLAPSADRLIDSMPVMLAKGARSGRSRRQRVLCQQGELLLRRQTACYRFAAHTTVTTACALTPEPRFATRLGGVAGTQPRLG
jgi:hypothetical protein